MQPIFANRSSLVPPDSRPAVPSQAPAAPAAPAGHRSAQIDSFPSFQESDFMVVGGNLLQTPIWLPSDGQVDYASMMQHLFQAKRSLQRISGSISRAQEERRKVQGCVLKSLKELEAKCGIMKSSKCADNGVVLYSLENAILDLELRRAMKESLAWLTPLPSGTVEVMEEMVITQSQALNVLKNKKGGAKKRDKKNVVSSADQSGSVAAVALASEVSDGTDEAEHLADECDGGQGILLHAAEAEKTINSGESGDVLNN